MTKYVAVLPRSAIVVTLVLVAVVIVTIFGVMAGTGGMTGKVRRPVSLRDSSMASLPDDMSSDELQDAIVLRFPASDDETDDDEVQFEDAVSALEKMVEDGDPVPIDGLDGVYVGGVGTYQQRKNHNILLSI